MTIIGRVRIIIVVLLVYFKVLLQNSCLLVWILQEGSSDRQESLVIMLP